MVICIVIYLIGIAALFLAHKKRLPQACMTKEAKQIFLILLLSNTLALFLFMEDAKTSGKVEEIYRNSYGEGEKSETFKVIIGDDTEKEITVEIEEQEYTRQEIQSVFEKLMEMLDAVILGENESFDYVDKDLNLVATLEEYPVEIQWEIVDSDILDTSGKIYQEYTKEEGTLVEIRGMLTYKEEQAMYIRTVMIYPRAQSDEEKLITQVHKLFQNVEEMTRAEKSFQLPASLEGNEIRWEKEPEIRGYYILILGGVLAVLIIALKRQNEKKAEEARIYELTMDYPEIISKFTLLLNTGMNVKYVWERIIKDYEAQKVRTGKRIVYEEMCYAYREMNGGISESEAYERFGRRCKTASYIKFGALLSQNLRKGTKGLTQMLELEAIQAFENRKNQARRLGEEAGTKLLMPMFAMLGIVLVMIIIPAFLTMQL